MYKHHRNLGHHLGILPTPVFKAAFPGRTLLFAMTSPWTGVLSHLPPVQLHTPCKHTGVDHTFPGVDALCCVSISSENSPVVLSTSVLCLESQVIPTVKKGSLRFCRRDRDTIAKCNQDWFQFSWPVPLCGIQNFSLTSQAWLALPHLSSSRLCSLVSPTNSCVLTSVPRKLYSNHLDK